MPDIPAPGTALQTIGAGLQSLGGSLGRIARGQRQAQRAFIDTQSNHEFGIMKAQAVSIYEQFEASLLGDQNDETFIERFDELSERLQEQAREQLKMPNAVAKWNTWFIEEAGTRRGGVMAAARTRWQQRMEFGVIQRATDYATSGNPEDLRSELQSAVDSGTYTAAEAAAVLNRELPRARFNRAWRMLDGIDVNAALQMVEQGDFREALDLRDDQVEDLTDDLRDKRDIQDADEERALQQVYDASRQTLTDDWIAFQQEPSTSIADQVAKIRAMSARNEIEPEEAERWVDKWMRAAEEIVGGASVADRSSPEGLRVATLNLTRMGSGNEYLDSITDQAELDPGDELYLSPNDWNRLRKEADTVFGVSTTGLPELRQATNYVEDWFTQRLRESEGDQVRTDSLVQQQAEVLQYVTLAASAGLVDAGTDPAGYVKLAQARIAVEAAKEVKRGFVGRELLGAGITRAASPEERIRTITEATAGMTVETRVGTGTFTPSGDLLIETPEGPVIYTKASEVRRAAAPETRQFGDASYVIDRERNVVTITERGRSREVRLHVQDGREYARLSRFAGIDLATGQQSAVRAP